ncbi:hypothetical protein FHP29_14985 [Nocardioides albidus]|uniref:Uncharacterized protein n=1 Tax=Nocardioides albidus TaxID=1517589 RepID=A0A5C4VRV8_9ACTN|nr:hypothetical protein [Nocardioides albidus]TNM38540.1 hypothetical protein FHP29_14985 [Nocardioides albidus]
MSTEDTDPQEVRWEAMPLEEAWELRRRWDETAEARVAWLRAESGLDLLDDPESIAELWSWFLRWADAPSGLDGSPAPVWWAPPVADTLAYRRQFGVEAIVAHLEQLCRQRFPELVPAVNVYPKGRKEPTSPHEPGLAFTPAPDDGAAWPTGQVVGSAMRIAALPESDPRRGRWGLRQFGDIATWVENKRKAQKKATKAPTVVIEKIPADEAEELGGFAWDISFDEEVGYDQPELVEAYAEALDDLDGIDEVEHYDRGMIRIAGPIGVRKLRSWSRKWLETNAESAG